MSAKHTARYDTAWRRLPWTGSLALLSWVVGFFALSYFIGNAAAIAERPAIEAHFVELPEPPVLPPPEQKDPPPEQLPPKQTPPVTAHPPLPPKPMQAQTPASSAAPQPMPTAQDISEPAAQPTQSVSQDVAQPVQLNAPRFANHPGAMERAGLLSVIVDRRPFNPPNPYAYKDASIYNEEAYDPGASSDISGPVTGTWHQEFNQPCGNPPDPHHPDYSCGEYFSQPSAPWCYDSIRPTNIFLGSCLDDFRRAIAAYKRTDYATALALFNKLAAHEYYWAESSLASMYAEGKGVQKDMQQAVYWWRKAAKDGDAKSVYNLALIYSEGTAVAKDEQQAAIWYRKAAYLGFDFAQYNLGVMYAMGTTLPRDDKQAVFWFRKAAMHGNLDAQYNMGVMNAEGAGLPKSDSAAAYWYCKAMSRGEPKSMSSLIQLLVIGDDVPSAQEVAYFCWLYWLPKRVASTAEQERDFYEKVLTPQQRSHVQETARRWQAKPDYGQR
ncbi:MAG TPA: hypothetical protein VIF82_00875 [Burkholderiaceae bacterium]|jgi:TPR repeat protein